LTRSGQCEGAYEFDNDAATRGPRRERKNRYRVKALKKRRGEEEWVKVRRKMGL
jgi:hypothetical protein